MKPALHTLAWGFAVAAVVYAAVGPGMGVLYGNPLACLGVGLIGLGLCLEGRRRAVAVSVRAAGARGGHETR